MDELLLVRVLTRLVQVHFELGPKCFEDAVSGALVAIGRSALRAAEVEAGKADPHGANVVPFPSRRLDDLAGDDGTP